MKATPEAGVALLPTYSSVMRIKYQAFACRLTDWIDYLILWNRISIMNCIPEKAWPYRHHPRPWPFAATGHVMLRR